MKIGKTTLNVKAFAGKTLAESTEGKPSFIAELISSNWREIQAQLKLMSMETEPKPKRKVKKEEENNEEEGE